MLHELRIQNLAVIERAEIAFGPGLNVLTGETGAGKSILISALGLLVGERAAGEQVASSKAFVEGAFDLSRSPGACAFLEEQGIELEDGSTLIVAREISVEGRNRVRLNGRLATAATLREMGQMLVDLHGQHEHQRLLKSESHLEFLDNFGDAKHTALREDTRAAWEAFRAAQKQLDAVTQNEQQRAQRLDMLQFQASEIDALAPEIGEDEKLSDERTRLMNAEKLRDAAALCRDALQGDEEMGALNLARQALQAAREIAATDTSISGWLEELQSAIYQLEDAAEESRAYADSLESDPLRLEDIEARLHRLTRLKRKYGDSVARVLEYRAEIERELSSLNLGEAETEELRRNAARLRGEYSQKAQSLSKSRRALSKKFAREVENQLQTLAMERARFEVHFENEENGGANGNDRVEFLLSANPGQPPRPLARIASGGEISRVMLALRTVLAQTEYSQSGVSGSKKERVPASGKVPIIVFDEIDTGIGGVTAEAVGEKMQELARSFQVFCVTHLPQIAKRADHHLQVFKSSNDARTSVQIQVLEGEARVRELARMMGRESAANLHHARDMLEGAPANENGARGKRAKTRSSS
jgi:DNA repair protein RecN (Recombination protein N)